MKAEGFKRVLLSTVLIVLLLVALVLTGATSGSTKVMTAEDLSRSIAPKENKCQKMESIVAQFINVSENKPASVQSFANARGISVVDGKIRVVLELTDENASLENYDIKIEAKYKNLVQAIVPVYEIKRIAQDGLVKYIRLPLAPHPTVTSEGVGVIGADNVHANGTTGHNVKIAITDLGFKGYATNPEVPAGNIIEAKSFRADGDIEAGEVHGTACTEIVLDTAPDARLYLLNFGTDVEFANAVNYAISKGVDIISCSICWANAGGYDGTGYICDIVNNAHAHGIFWAQSAGNYAERHYEGTYTDTNGDNLHEFSPSPIDENLDLGWLPAYTPITLYLSWDDWPYSNQDYDLYLLEYTTASGWQIAAWSINPQTGTQPPTEAIGVYDTVEAYWVVVIGKYSATRNVHFELYSFTNNFPEYDVKSSSLLIPADATGAVTAGATYWGNDSLEHFSSRGPTNDGRTKPDVTAPDGVSTSVYGPGNFYGTSASAPCIAGAAALLLDAKATLTADEVQSLLESTAIDLGTPGKDSLYGFGRVNVWAAYQEIIDVTAPAAPTLVSPANGENLNYNTPTLNWSAVSDNSPPVFYYAAVSNNSAFPYENRSSGWTTTDNWEVMPALPEGVWYWRVRAKDNVGNVGDNSASRSFRVDVTRPAAPTITAPANGENTNDNTPNLDWGAVSENSLPVLYRVWIDNNSNFSSPEKDSGWIGATSYTPSALPDNLYYLRVAAKDNAGNQGDNSQRTFRVDTLKPAAPTLIWPANGENINDNTPNLDWGAVSENSLPVLYRCYVDNDSNFSSVDYDSGWVTTDNYQLTSELTEKVWYWKVGAKDNAGNVGEWSATWSLHIGIVRGVEVVITPPSQENDNGGTLAYTVTVKNTGNVSDTYTLENTDNAGWTKSLSNTSVGPLSPNASDNTTTLRVTIPEDADNGTEDNITVTATSQENAQVSDNASCIAHAGFTAEEFSLHLVAGWNLVGFPVTNADMTPNKLLAGTTYTMYYWDAPGGPYNEPPNKDLPVEDNRGYWVKENRDKTITYSGIRSSDTPGGGVKTMYFVAGWNLVCFPWTSANTTPNNLFAGTTFVMYYWDAPGGPYNEPPNKDLPVEDNRGYWVKENQNISVTIPI